MRGVIGFELESGAAIAHRSALPNDEFIVDVDSAAADAIHPKATFAWQHNLWIWTRARKYIFDGITG